MTDYDLRVETAVAQLVGTWDPIKLERAIANLLTNGVKYRLAGAEVLVRLRREDDSPSSTPATTSAPGRCWTVVEVEDHGLGIPVSDLLHIFKPFHRAANPSSHSTGLRIGLQSAQ